MYRDFEPNSHNRRNSPWSGGSESGGNGSGKPSNSFWDSAKILLVLLLIIILVPVSCSLFVGSSPGNAISYTAFRREVAADNVEEITLTGDEIRGRFVEPVATIGRARERIVQTHFVTYLPALEDAQLLALLDEHNVDVYTARDSSFPWLTLILGLLPVLLLLGFGYMYFKQPQTRTNDILSLAKTRAKRYNANRTRTTFHDVAGADGAKRELEEIIEYLRNPGRFQRLGAVAPTGVLLVGPPGTGKTLLARAVAGEAKVPFFSISGSDFMEMFVGVGASRVRDMFKEAKKQAPGIIFIDELDSIGRKRGAGVGGGHDERAQTLNQLLSEMDGFEVNEHVIVIAATNRPDVLDQALLRPGRFDRRITVDLPTKASRLAILRIHADNKPLADDVDLDEVARGTAGFSGADLENLLNEAALLAVRAHKEIIEQQDIDAARDKVLMGLAREGLTLTPDELQLLAYHEAGHAVVAAVLPHADPVHKVTIVPRGRAMGVTQQMPEQDKYLYPREYMLDRLAVMLGGQAAENLIFETVTSGAENDLKQATTLARKMVLEWGMSRSLGHVALGDPSEQVFLGAELTQRRDYSEATAREIDEEIKQILNEAFQQATDTLQRYRDGLDQLAAALIEKEEIYGQEVLTLVGVERKEPVRLVIAQG